MIYLEVELMDGNDPTLQAQLAEHGGTLLRCYWRPWEAQAGDGEIWLFGFASEESAFAFLVDVFGKSGDNGTDWELRHVTPEFYEHVFV